MLLIWSLTNSYDTLEDTLIYERDFISLEEVHATLMAKELSKNVSSKEVNTEENLSVKGRCSKRQQKGKKKSRSISKSDAPWLKCFNFHKEGHFKRDCMTKNKKV